MNITGQFQKDGDTIKYDISDEQKDEIVKILIEYYADPKHCHFGEGIHQNDDSIIDAPGVLSDICDNIIHFMDDVPDNDPKPIGPPNEEIKENHVPLIIEHPFEEDYGRR